MSYRKTSHSVYNLKYHTNEIIKQYIESQGRGFPTETDSFSLAEL